MIRRLSLFTVIALFVLAGTALAAVTKSKSKSVTITAGTTKTVVVPYPDALKFGNAKYSCTVKVVTGTAKVVSKGSAQGGSVCQAKIKATGNGNAKVTVTAKTVEPSQGARG
jgi:hypothetical protein